MPHFHQKKQISITCTFITICFSILLAACTNSILPETPQSPPPHTSSPVSPTPISPPPLVSTANLTHSPTGTMDMSWDPQRHILTVKVAMTGLAPKSTHPEHIHWGTCDMLGVIYYYLNPLVADDRGIATVTTTIPDVISSIPAYGWAITIHNGPTMNAQEGSDILSCGNITQTSTSSAPIHLTLGGSIAPDRSAHGKAQLTITGKKLVVILTVSGLVPGSSHMAHIHQGTCDSQGPVVYPLSQVNADARGDARSQTSITLSNVQQFLASKHYINIHEAGTPIGMQTQQGFDPIVCGNISFPQEA